MFDALYCSLPIGYCDSEFLYEKGEGNTKESYRKRERL
jgi:hypothetical protein